MVISFLQTCSSAWGQMKRAVGFIWVSLNQTCRMEGYRNELSWDCHKVSSPDADAEVMFREKDVIQESVPVEGEEDGCRVQ